MCLITFQWRGNYWMGVLYMEIENKQYHKRSLFRKQWKCHLLHCYLIREMHHCQTIVYLRLTNCQVPWIRSTQSILLTPHFPLLEIYTYIPISFLLVNCHFSFTLKNKMFIIFNHIWLNCFILHNIILWGDIGLNHIVSICCRFGDVSVDEVHTQRN